MQRIQAAPELAERGGGGPRLRLLVGTAHTAECRCVLPKTPPLLLVCEASCHVCGAPMPKSPRKHSNHLQLVCRTAESAGRKPISFFNLVQEALRAQK